MQLMGCHLLEELFPGASAFVASFLPFNMQTNCLPPRETSYARGGVCIQLRKRSLWGLKACLNILLSFDYGNLKSVRYLPCLYSNGNLIYSLACQI